MSESLRWFDASISEISAQEFHNLLKLRIDVFVVEQACVYPELDGKDALLSTQHIFAVQPHGEVIAAARVLASDATQPVRIGRVVVAPEHRGTGLSYELMSRVMAYCERVYPRDVLELSAQVGVERLYQHFGFKVISDAYLEDGIPHWDMRLSPSAT